MERKRWKMALVALGIGTVALLIGLVLGCGTRVPREGAEGGWACRKGPHPRLFGGDVSERVLKRLDGHVEDLNLTEAQKERYDAIRERVKSELARGKAARALFMQEVQRQMAKEPPDLNAMASLLREHSRQMPEFVDRHVRIFQDLYDILDETQKAKVADHLKTRLRKIPLPAGGMVPPEAPPPSDAPATGSQQGKAQAPEELRTTSPRMAYEGVAYHGDLL